MSPSEALSVVAFQPWKTRQYGRLPAEWAGHYAVYGTGSFPFAFFCSDVRKVSAHYSVPLQFLRHDIDYVSLNCFQVEEDCREK